ncbi:MAG: PIG-L family deacetylase [Gemmatimonadaceae bacterium]|nr:PIG-L family deacetylase [Gemmatimonadaceae bacterium]
MIGRDLRRRAGAVLGVLGTSFACATASLAVSGTSLAAQPTDAAALDEVVRSLGVTTRVLMIAAHPDDEDTQLLTWLARARGVETAYLSLTRGDGGQNLIGNELGEALGAIRTEELLAARRIDGARQFFTRAYDFGFSKTPTETFTHWPRDTVFGDVLRVVRSFRPHVIIAVFSGTPRDGHGHHQVSGLLARQAYEESGDTVRYAAATYGAPWTVAKFYRAARFRAGDASLTFDVGGYSPLRGRGYAELAGESRSQHKSQGFGVLQRKGSVPDYVLREATRVNSDVDAKAERDLFDGISTGWARLRGALGEAAADSMQRAAEALRERIDFRAPWPAVRAFVETFDRVTATATCAPRSPSCDDLRATLAGARARRDQLLAIASGLALEATVSRGILATGDTLVAQVTLHNRGVVPLRWRGLRADGRVAVQAMLADTTVAPGASVTRAVRLRATGEDGPWWRRTTRDADWWREAIGASTSTADGWSLVDDEREGTSRLIAQVEWSGGTSVAAEIAGPVVHRFADPVKGDQQRALMAATPVSLTMERAAAYVRAQQPIARTIRVTLRSTRADTLRGRVELQLPAGLSAPNAASAVLLPPGAVRTLEFEIRGTLTPGAYTISAAAVVTGGDGVEHRIAHGFDRIDYDHIRPLHLRRPASLTLTSVELAGPAGASIGYIAGVGDNVRPMLEDLGYRVTTLDPAQLGREPLRRFSAVVVGPRAYEAHPALLANADRLLEYARDGGTLVVQYGQYEMTTPGVMPYPVTIARPHDRVTEEEAAVTVLRPEHPVLTTPNRLSSVDWSGWVQERALYMPRTFDARYTPLVSMQDAGEDARTSGILVAPVGRGVYVYSTLAFFRQLPAGHPGAARLFANLLSTTPRRVMRTVP